MKQHEAEINVKILCQQLAEKETEAATAAAAEADEADERPSADGRTTRRMTAGLISRAVRSQCTEYRTARLASKLELSLLSLRDISPALSQLTLLTSLRLEHNAIESLSGLELPLLKILVAHHNRLQALGATLQGLPRLLLLDVGHNMLSTLDGVEHCVHLAQLSASGNQICGKKALEPLIGCVELSTVQLADNLIASLQELEPLAQMHNLRTLVLASNPVYDVGRCRLLEHLPRLRILDALPNHALERAEHREKMRARQESIARSTAMMRRIKEKAESKRMSCTDRHPSAASVDTLDLKGQHKCGSSAELEGSNSSCTGAISLNNCGPAGISDTQPGHPPQSIQLEEDKVANSDIARSSRSSDERLKEGGIPWGIPSTMTPLSSDPRTLQNTPPIEDTADVEGGSKSNTDTFAQIEHGSRCRQETDDDSIPQHFTQQRNTTICENSDGVARRQTHVEGFNIYNASAGHFRSQRWEARNASSTHTQWNASLDATLTCVLRENGFDFKRAADVLSSEICRDQHTGLTRGIRSITLDQCRRRWSVLDQRICTIMKERSFANGE